VQSVAKGGSANVRTGPGPRLSRGISVSVAGGCMICFAQSFCRLAGRGLRSERWRQDMNAEERATRPLRTTYRMNGRSRGVTCRISANQAASDECKYSGLCVRRKARTCPAFGNLTGRGRYTGKWWAICGRCARRAQLDSCGWDGERRSKRGG